VKEVDENKFFMMLFNEPLIECSFSLPMIKKEVFTSEGGAIYYGTGLCNSHTLTIAMPFDVLSMVLVAEKLRQALGLSKVFHHIADTHALCNFPNNRDAVLQKAEEMEIVMQKVVQRLGLKHFVIVRSSSFDSSEEYLDFLREVSLKTREKHDGEYFQRELADMLWYRQKHNMVVKLGWTSREFSFDERWYDNQFVEHFGRLISFIYTKPGRTFTGKVVPYIAATDSDRILLRPGESVREKFEQAASIFRKDTIAGVTNYFAMICRLYKSLGIGPLNEKSIPQKVQQIIDHIFI